MKKTEIAQKNNSIIITTLQQYYPEAECALEHASPYELLIATILSAQCTDVRVNIVTKELFKQYNTPQKMITLSNSQLESMIHSCGFYRNKAANILNTSRILVEKYNAEVPADIKLLQELPGVGRKTANVVCSVAFGIPAIAVDTHVFRVANRLGLTTAKDELHTELQLMEVIDQTEWISMHHVLIWHGRRICSSQKPKCVDCPVRTYCRYYTCKEQACS